MVFYTATQQKVSTQHLVALRRPSITAPVIR